VTRSVKGSRSASGDPRPWRRAKADLPPDIPTMITSEERSYLYWLTGELWDGNGEVVEVGPWLGGSTWLLASGMESNPHRRAGRRLHSIDDFLWRPFMAQRAELDLEPGASFRRYFERNLAPKGELVAVHEAALPDDGSLRLVASGGDRASRSDLPLFLGDSIPGDIAIVFVDGAKSWMAFRHLIVELAPRFVPGETILVLQDFQLWLAYWVPMAVALLLRTCPGSLSLTHTLPFNTVTFRVVGRISREAVGSFPTTIDHVSVAEGERLLEDAAEMLEDQREPGAAAVVRLSQTAFLGTKGSWDQALEAFRRAEARWPLRGAPISQLAEARSCLVRETGVALPPSRHARRVTSWTRARDAVVRRVASKRW
jgi:hypothetical protein